MKCAHCGAPKAEFVWTLQACAEGRRKRRPRLCGPCDVELNRLVLAFVRAPNVEAKVAAYGVQTLGPQSLDCSVWSNDNPDAEWRRVR